MVLIVYYNIFILGEKKQKKLHKGNNLEIYTCFLKWPNNQVQ
jgi:hypothetical protein